MTDWNPYIIDGRKLDDDTWFLKTQAFAGLPPGSIVWFLESKAWKGECIADSIEDIRTYSELAGDYLCLAIPPDFALDWMLNARCAKCHIRFKDHP